MVIYLTSGILFSELAALFQKLIPAFIFSVLLLVCVCAMACRNIVRYFTGYDPNSLADDLEALERSEGNNISSYKLSENLEDTISPQNAKQLVVDSTMTDVMYTWVHVQAQKHVRCAWERAYTHVLDPCLEYRTEMIRVGGPWVRKGQTEVLGDKRKRRRYHLGYFVPWLGILKFLYFNRLFI